MTRLTDTSPMPWGMHKGKPMQDVPVTYLHWLWTKEGWNRTAARGNPVADYCFDNINALKMENRDLIW